MGPRRRQVVPVPGLARRRRAGLLRRAESHLSLVAGSLPSAWSVRAIPAAPAPENLAAFVWGHAAARWCRPPALLAAVVLACYAALNLIFR
jgi:hypothetical protein